MKFHFVEGPLCLDFANTGGEDMQGKLGQPHATYEDLVNLAECARWLSESSLALPTIPVTPEELAEARRLRDAIWYGAYACLEQTVIAPEHIAVINAMARHPALIPQFEFEPRGSRWHEPTVRQALSTIARDAIDLLTSAHASRIRECASAHCILLFVDTSRPGKRRWCDMDRCGNQAKNAEYRRRARL